MADFGGIMRFTFGGQPLRLRGKVETEPASQEADPIANNDGSIARAMKVVGYRAEVSFEDSVSGIATVLNWNQILLGGPYNMTITEDQTGVVHTFTQALFAGKPKVDRMNGEVTGLSIIAPTYKAVKR